MSNLYKYFIHIRLSKTTFITIFNALRYVLFKVNEENKFKLILP